ncbi:MAG: hypothetical protein LQ344_004922 [Seirophora lacunosa]|nr:MAG: hypothetical protein LQ344_004922 [Seirophora lacunosa]
MDAMEGSMSPASEQGAHSLELTPKSKLRAMMTAIDDDSGSDASIHGASSRNDNSSLEDLSFRTLAPRGKMAARLKKLNAPNQLPSEDDKTGQSSAYARLKKKLEAPSPKPPVVERSDTSPERGPSTDEDDVLPAVARRKRRASQKDSGGSPPLAASLEEPLQLSPGLFLTPPRLQRSRTHSPLLNTSYRNRSESDSPANDAQPNLQLLALVARKKEERLAKAEKEAAMKAERLAESRRQQSDRSRNRVDSLGSSEDESDIAGGRKLTQQARPTRKASKRALEETNRETQRMNRNMQLAHQARTKKKITKESLFARFNFRNGNSAQHGDAPANSSSAAASSNPASDAEARHGTETPPTSPIKPGDDFGKSAEQGQGLAMSAELQIEEPPVHSEEELPDMQTIIAQSQQPRGNVIPQGDEVDCGHRLLDRAQTPIKEKVATKNLVNVRLPNPMARLNPGEESDSDLEILPVDKTKRKLDVFDRIPASKVSEGRSLQTLRALAQLSSSNNHTGGAKSNTSLTEMQNTLQRRARQQAARERAEKIQDLKDRGILVQTAEERQKDQAEVEDLLERARREAVELQRHEKDAAKQRAKADGETPVDASSDEDEDYQDRDADESEVDLSGSEDDAENRHEADNGVDKEQEYDQKSEKGDSDSIPGSLIENEASEASNDESEEDEEEEGEAFHPDNEMLVTRDEKARRIRVRRGKNNVIDDDDDDEEIQEFHSEKINSARVDQRPLLDLGLPQFAGAPMGMTQAFAATMADSQTQASDLGRMADQEEDSLAFLGAPPEPEYPVFNLDDSLPLVMDSQEASISNSKSQTEITLDFSQSRLQDTNTYDITAETPATQMSEIPDPTQDVGFALTSPVAGRYDSIPPSSVDTLILPQANKPDSPIVKKKGRLVRKGAGATDAELDFPAGVGKDEVGTVIPANAFDVLKKGPKKPHKAAATFDKKKSNAHEMVEEQAQESEDEYAGLGGASDDESGAEEDEEVRKMIEQGEVDVDERQLAAFYANKERASDEKAVEKLFKDINNGMLRRKRGAEFDLSDSEDDIEARRSRKRREFAKMRKALLENENVGKIAEDPKKLAFLRAIEDRDDDEDLDFLDQPEAASQPAVGGESQETADSQAQARPEPLVLGKRKRPLTESVPDAANRPPPSARRTFTESKPQSLAEIRASVSFLTEEPDVVTIAPLSSSPAASDNENENDENINIPSSTIRRTDKNPFSSHRQRTNSNAAVIDRLSLKRTSTASTSTATSKLFFHAPTADSSNFRVPSLLRRATTSSSSSFLSNVNSKTDQHGISTFAGTERAAGGGEKGDFVRKGGTKRSSVNWNTGDGAATNPQPSPLHNPKAFLLSSCACTPASSTHLQDQANIIPATTVRLHTPLLLQRRRTCSTPHIHRGAATRTILIPDPTAATSAPPKAPHRRVGQE